MFDDSGLSARFVALLKAGLRYALPCVLLAACGGDITPMTPGGAAGTAVMRSAPTAVTPAKTKSKTFAFTGQPQSFIVPVGIKRITITAVGAGTSVARGSLVAATIAVQPGESLAVFVGGESQRSRGGFNGGGDGGMCACPLASEGGAGASDVREGGSASSDRVIVAGGAGGRGGRGQHRGGRGGMGGGLIGQHGHPGIRSVIGNLGGGGGAGGAQTEGGVAGTGGATPSRSGFPGMSGASGTLGTGGAGSDTSNACFYVGGGGGGGGGGYYGGGGGGSGATDNGSAPPTAGELSGIGSGGGGGGGSSFVVSSATDVTMQKGGGSAGNGQVVISWQR
jgi:hypothetical protein